MIKNIAKKSLVVALLAGIGFGATAVQAQERVYVIDQRDVVALSGFGLCWRRHRLLDPGGCRQGSGWLPVRQGPAAEGSLRTAGTCPGRRAEAHR